MLKDILHYDKETGLFTWLITVNNNSAVKGQFAGTLNIRSGYVFITVNGVKHRAHRLAWFFVHDEWPDVIDHINRVRNDNRIANLRSITKAENSLNKSIGTRNKTGVHGVSVCKQTGKYRADIRVNNKRYNLGRFDSLFDAVSARKSAEIKLHNYSPSASA